MARIRLLNGFGVLRLKLSQMCLTTRSHFDLTNIYKLQSIGHGARMIHAQHMDKKHMEDESTMEKYGNFIRTKIIFTIKITAGLLFFH